MEKTKEQNRDEKRKADIRELENAVDRYYVDKGAYPDVGGMFFLLMRLKEQGYIKELIVDPREIDMAGIVVYKGYRYGVSEDRQYCRLEATLEDNSIYEAGNATGDDAGKVEKCERTGLGLKKKKE